MKLIKKHQFGGLLNLLKPSKNPLLEEPINKKVPPRGNWTKMEPLEPDRVVTPQYYGPYTLPGITVTAPNLKKAQPFPYGGINVESKNGQTLAYPTGTTPLQEAVFKNKAKRDIALRGKLMQLGGSFNQSDFKENLEPPTLGFFGELERNLSKGNEIFGRMISSPATQILLTGIGAGIGGIAGPTMKISKTAKEVVTNPRNAIRKLSRNLNAKKGDPSFRWTKTSGNLRNGTAQEYTYQGMGRNTQRGVLKTGRSEGSGYNAQASLNRNPTYLKASAPALTQSQRFWNNNRAEPVEWLASRRVMQRNNLIDLARDWRNYIFENPSYGRLNFKVK